MILFSILTRRKAVERDELEHDAIASFEKFYRDLNLHLLLPGQIVIDLKRIFLVSIRTAYEMGKKDGRGRS